MLEPRLGAARRVASPWPRGPRGTLWPRAGSRGTCFAFTRRLQGQLHSALLGEGTLQEAERAPWSPRSLPAPTPVTPAPVPFTGGHPTPGWPRLGCSGCGPHSAHGDAVTVHQLCGGDEALASSAPAAGTLEAHLSRWWELWVGMVAPQAAAPMPEPGTAPRDTGWELSPDLGSHPRSGPVLPSLLGLESGVCIQVELSWPALGQLGACPGLCVLPRTYPHRSANFRSPGIGPLLGGRWLGTERCVL